MPFPEFIMKVLTALAVFFAPIQTTLIAISLLIIFDAITGIGASLKKGEKFSSAKMFNSIVKLVFYGLLIITSRMIEQHLVTTLPLVELSVYMVVAYEFTSFLENVGIIVERDVFKWFKEALGNLKRKNQSNTDQEEEK